MSAQNIPVRKFAKQSGDFLGSFTMRAISELLAGVDMRESLHRHDFFFVLVVEEGRGTHAIDFKTYEICDNTIFIVRPGQVHQLYMKAGSNGYVMQFEKDVLATRHSHVKGLLQKSGLQNIYNVSADSYQEIKITLRQIFNEQKSRRVNYNHIIAAQLEVFLIQLLRTTDSNSSGHEHSYAQQKLTEFLDALDKGVSKDNGVAHYAKLLRVTSYQLNAITKKLLGKSASDIIVGQIVLEAKRLLLATANQVSQVADDLGYEDPSYFIRFFKKHTGYTPESFRKNFA